MPLNTIRVTRRYNIGTYGYRILFKLTERDTGEPKDLTGYSSIRFHMWAPGNSYFYLEGSCIVHDADKGECTYLVERGDFSDLGEYYAEIELRKNGILEDSEIFKIILQGVELRCPPSIDYSSSGISLNLIPDSHYYKTPIDIQGSIKLSMDTSSTVIKDYYNIGESLISLEVESDYLYDELYTNTYSVNLGGANEHISVSNSSDWYFYDNDFLISMWLKFNNLSGTQTLLGQWDSGDSKSWILKYGVGNFIFAYSNDGNNVDTAAFPYTPSSGSWYHLFLRRNGSDLNFAINDIPVGIEDIGSVSLFNSTQELLIGKDADSGEYLTANVDELSIWKYIIPSFLDLYNSGTPSDLSEYPEYADYCFAWFRMGEGSSFPTINNEKGLPHGTMVNCEAGDIEADVPGGGT